MTKLSNWKYDQNVSDDELKLREKIIDKYVSCMNNGSINFNLSNNRHCLKKITSLPDYFPDHLKSISVERNELKFLPERLPSGLLSLNLANNNVTSVHNVIPNSLNKFNARGNRIKFIPDTFRGIKEKGTFNVKNNPIIRRSVEEFHDVKAGNPEYPYTGPYIYSPEGYNIEKVTDLINDLFGNDMPGDILCTWSVIQEKEEECSYLSGFIEYMIFALKIKNKPICFYRLKKAIIEATHDEIFRKKLYGVSLDALKDCRQRIYHGYSAMELLLLERDVRSKLFENNIELLLTMTDLIFQHNAIYDILFLDGKYNPIFSKRKKYEINKVNLFDFLCNTYYCEEQANTKYEKEIITASLKERGVLIDEITNQLILSNINSKVYASSPWRAYVETHHKEIFEEVMKNELIDTQNPHFYDILRKKVAKEINDKDLSNSIDMKLIPTPDSRVQVSEKLVYYFNRYLDFRLNRHSVSDF